MFLLNFTQSETPGVNHVHLEIHTWKSTSRRGKRNSCWRTRFAPSEFLNFWFQDLQGSCFITRNFIFVECLSANCKERRLLLYDICMIYVWKGICVSFWRSLMWHEYQWEFIFNRISGFIPDMSEYNRKGFQYSVDIFKYSRHCKISSIRSKRIWIIRVRSFVITFFYSRFLVFLIETLTVKLWTCIIRWKNAY